MVFEGPQISVVMPVYNAGSYIGQAIDSIRIQNYRPLQIILVDDGSTDGCVEKITDADLDIDVLKQANLGPGAARNTGIEKARGEYLAFLDADDLWVENKLKRQVQVLAERHDADIVLGYVEQFHSPELTEEEKRKTPVTPGKTPGYLCGSMMIRRVAFNRVGWFETKWKTGEFVDWYARATHAGLVSVLIPEVVLRRRIHRSNLTLREGASKAQFTEIVRQAIHRRKR